MKKRHGCCGLCSANSAISQSPILSILCDLRWTALPPIVFFGCEFQFEERFLMFIKVKRGWEIPERLATPEHVFFNRRRFLVTGAAIGAMTALSACEEKQEAQAEANAAPDPSASLYPVKRNET